MKATCAPNLRALGFGAVVYRFERLTACPPMATLSYFWPATRTPQCVGAHGTPDSFILFKYPDFMLDLDPETIVSNSPVIVKIERRI